MEKIWKKRHQRLRVLMRQYPPETLLFELSAGDQGSLGCAISEYGELITLVALSDNIDLMLDNYRNS